MVRQQKLIPKSHLSAHIFSLQSLCHQDQEHFELSAAEAVLADSQVLVASGRQDET